MVVKLVLLILMAITMPVWAAVVLVSLAYISLFIVVWLVKFISWMTDIAGRLLEKLWNVELK